MAHLSSSTEDLLKLFQTEQELIEKLELNDKAKPYFEILDHKLV